MLVVPMWPGLRAGFCRRLLSTMLEVLEARLSRVLKEKRGGDRAGGGEVRTTRRRRVDGEREREGDQTE